MRVKIKLTEFRKSHSKNIIFKENKKCLDWEENGRVC